MVEPIRELSHGVEPDDDSLIAEAAKVLELESQAILDTIPRLGPSFARSVRLLLECRGRVIVTGMGKAGFVAQKLSATLASTGTPSHFLHPAEALHGDLGRIAADDVVVALSNSGESDELVAMFPALKCLGVKLVAITGKAQSPLAREAQEVIDIGSVKESCPLGLAPTASAAVLLAVSDALAMGVLRLRNFAREDYARLHPAGTLGRRLRKVGEVMRRGMRNPMIHEDASVSEALAVMTRTPGRPGATSVIDRERRLVGVFTDGDLRRLVQSENAKLDCAVSTVMTRNPQTVDEEMLVMEAVEVLRRYRIDQVPVVDASKVVVGLLDVQDLLGDVQEEGEGG